LNVKFSKDLKIINSTFSDNNFDQVDLDNVSAEIVNSVFDSKNRNNDGDSLDVSMSNIKISCSKLMNSLDKGFSVGEASNVYIYDSLIAGNNIGIASKDASKVISSNLVYQNNKVDNSTYLKKYFFETPGEIIRVKSNYLCDSSS